MLIAGAGDVGVRLGFCLLRAGHHVFTLRRDTSGLPAELDPIGADLSDPESLRQLPAGLTHVVYTAAAPDSSDEAYERTYVRGLSNLMQAATRSSTLSRITFTSSTAVYAQTDGAWVDETSPTEPTHFAGLRTLEAEGVLRDSGVPHCILRCGGIYGPGRSQLVDRVRGGLAHYDPDRTQYTNRIHADDVAAALAFLTLHPDPPALVAGVDHEPAPRREVLEWLARRLGVPPPQPSATPGSQRRSESNKRVSSARLRALGYTFVYPTYREGYESLLTGAR